MTSLTTLLLSSCTVCPAQVRSHGDASEWASFVGPAVEPERIGPVADHQFQSLEQGGPWRTQPMGSMNAGEQQLLALIRQGRALEALALLKQVSPDPNAADELGATPLSLATARGELDLVKELLRRGADPDHVGAGGMTPLGGASFNGHELVVRELLRQGARTNVPGATGLMPLHLACATGQVRVVKQLMAAGAGLRAPHRQGCPAVAETGSLAGP